MTINDLDWERCIPDNYPFLGDRLLVRRSIDNGDYTYYFFPQCPYRWHELCKSEAEFVYLYRTTDHTEYDIKEHRELVNDIIRRLS